jgi:microsomal dipeptidase-like Zn-dependent dipeptidase
VAGGVITDLHCHYPMHLVHDELAPHGAVRQWWDIVKSRIEQDIFDVAGALFNQPGWGGGWRVDIDGLRDGGVATVCSVLYWPPSEFIPGPEGAHPKPGSFDDLVKQLDDVEAHLAASTNLVVRDAHDLDAADTPRFVHCIEGGFAVGPDQDAIAEHVKQLAQRGVFYITLAHLFFRGVATNAPALPPLTDEQYADAFPQPDEGLTDLGRTALRAMADRGIVPDVSHMSERALTETFELLDDVDPDKRLPVIATHVGARSAGPDEQQYNLTPESMRLVAQRNGVIGLILAQHQLGKTRHDDDSRALVARHINAIHDALGTHAHTGIGTDLDGFIKPTLHGIDRARDLGTLERWIREDFRQDADAILHGNADRVIRQAFDLRD